jgi:RND family efflux transporter MFP subunit
MTTTFTAMAKAIALQQRSWRATALAVAMVATGCSSPAIEHTETESAVAVEVQAAKIGTIEGQISVTGVVTPAPGADWIITAPEPARIAELSKAEGDAVKAGDVLVRFDIPTLASNVSARRAEVAQARARVETTRAAVTRISGLVDRGVAAKREMEEAQRDQADAEGALARAESEANAAAALAGRAVVTARFAGVVAKRWHNPGDMVEASAADPILRVIDPAKLQVVASVPASDLPRITVGRSGHVIGPGGTAEQDVTVVARPAQLDPSGSVAEVRLAFKGPTPFASGTPLQISIVAETHEKAVLVDAVAVQHEGDEAFVMIVKDDKKAHRQVVEVGLTAGGLVEIIKGVAAGDRVIVKGQNGLPDEAEVTVES